MLIAGLLLLASLEGQIYRIPALYSAIGDAATSVPTAIAGILALAATVLQRPLQPPAAMEKSMWTGVILTCVLAQFGNVAGITPGAGVMGPNTAMSFLLLSASQIGFRSWRPLAFPLYLLALVPPLVAIFGYLSWERGFFGEMAIFTAILLLALCVANAVRFARRPLLRPLVSGSPAGKAARAMLAVWAFLLALSAAASEWLRVEDSEVAHTVLLLLSALSMLGAIIYLSARFDESSETRRRVERRICDAVLRDPLTRAHTRAAAEIYLAAFGTSSCIGTVLFEIGPVKEINRRHGYAAGDLILSEVARQIRSDLASTELLVRWGGAEFLLLTRGLGMAELEARANDLCERASAVSVESCGLDNIAISAGVALTEPGQIELAAAVDMANRGLCTARADKVSRFTVVAA